MILKPTSVVSKLMGKENLTLQEKLGTMQVLMFGTITTETRRHFSFLLSQTVGFCSSSRGNLKLNYKFYIVGDLNERMAYLKSDIFMGDDHIIECFHFWFNIDGFLGEVK